MDRQEYTLEEISYSRKEHCRIMDKVLNVWFKDPKTLNFVAPSFSFPFQFKKWKSKFYKSEATELTTIILKKGNWIIGHLSIALKNKTGNLFNLFIDPIYRNKGLAIKMINEIESFGYNEGVREFSVSITPRNKAAITLFNKLKYKEKDKKSVGMVRMLKTIDG